MSVLRSVLENESVIEAKYDLHVFHHTICRFDTSSRTDPGTQIWWTFTVPKLDDLTT